MAKRKHSRGRTLMLTTYFISLATIILGLIFPITASTLSNGINFKTLPIMQVCGALAAFGIPMSIGANLTEAYSCPVSVFGISFDLGAALLIFYAITAIVALILAIPAAMTKEYKTRKLIFFAEAFALSALLLMGLTQFFKYSGDWNLSVLVPFGVTLLMLIIQSIAYRRGSGVIKTVLFLLSATAVFFTVSNITVILPALASPIGTVANAIKGHGLFDTGIGLYSIDGKDIFGSTLFTSLLKGDMSLGSGGKLAVAIASWSALVAVVLACLNLYLDMLGISKNTNGLMLGCNLIRYITEFLAIIIVAAILPFISGSYGIMLYLLAVIALIQLIIQIARRAKHKKAKAAVVAEESVDEDADIPDSDEEYAFEPAASTEVAATHAEPLVETRNIVYKTNYVYNGPVDDFIRKLSDEQKIEFSKLFIEKHPNISGIPDYVVGGDNSRFFSMLFIYFSRVRDLVTDGLMNKFYEEVKII